MQSALIKQRCSCRLKFKHYNMYKKVPHVCISSSPAVSAYCFLVFFDTEKPKCRRTSGLKLAVASAVLQTLSLGCTSPLVDTLLVDLCRRAERKGRCARKGRSFPPLSVTQAEKWHFLPRGPIVQNFHLHNSSETLLSPWTDSASPIFYLHCCY